MLELTSLYLMTKFVAISGYLPQLHKLVKDPDLAVDFSLVTWGLWTLSAVTYSIYIWLENRDPIMCATSTLSALGISSVFIATCTGQLLAKLKQAAV